MGCLSKCRLLDLILTYGISFWGRALGVTTLRLAMILLSLSRTAGPLSPALVVPRVPPPRLVISHQIKTKQQNPSPPPDQKETITLLALTGKGKEMNAFNTRFLGRISAINIFQDLRHQERKTRQNYFSLKLTPCLSHNYRSHYLPEAKAKDIKIL